MDIIIRIFKYLQNFIFALAALMFITFLAGVFFFPSTTSVQVQKQTELSAADLYDVIATASTWTYWSPIAPDGGGFRFRHAGPETGTGSELVCSHNGELVLTLSITETVTGFMVAYDMVSVQHPQNASGIFEMEPVDGETLIIWKHTTQWTNNPVLKIVGSFMSRRQRNDMQRSMFKLIDYTENQ